MFKVITLNTGVQYPKYPSKCENGKISDMIYRHQDEMAH